MNDEFKPGDVLEVVDQILVHSRPDPWDKEKRWVGPNAILTVITPRISMGLKALQIDLSWYKCLTSEGLVVYVMLSNVAVKAVIEGRDSGIRLVQYK